MGSLNPFVCRATLCGHCCCCGEMQITASCSRGGAGQLPAENACNCMNLMQAVSGKQHARSAKPLAGWNKVNKTNSFPEQSHDGNLVLHWRFLPIISDYLPLNAALSENYCPRCWKLPQSGYHGILVNSMQSLDVIFSLFLEPMNLFYKGPNGSKEYKENLILFVTI